MKKALVGYGGHAREVMAQMGLKLTCFVDDEFVTEDCLPLSAFNPNDYAIMVAIANSQDRLSTSNKLPKETKYFTFIHPTSLILGKDVIIGEGSFIGANSIITCNVKIGKHAILNRGNQIGHDCLIGDYFSAMPGSVVSGNCVIGNSVYLGTNSSIREKMNITDNVTIGLNTGIVKSVDKSGIYVGQNNRLI
jgi:sugar O-acyltransferase (sialic acid O-acetyltransferase NeuD family)